MDQPKNSKRSKKYVLNLNRIHSTKTKICSLGNVEIKYVSHGDTIEFSKILEEQISNRDFVVKILLHQLIEPKLDFETLQKLSDEELEKLAKVFVKAEDGAFKYFKDTGDYFKDFRQALKTGQEQQVEEFRKTFEPKIKSAQETLTVFSKNYASVIHQTLDSTSYIQEWLKGAAEVVKKISDAQFRFVEDLEPVIEQIQSMAKIINESLKPQIDFWQKWAEQNKRIFDSFSNFWIEFQRKYNVAEQKATQILRKYKWFITPSMPLSFVFKVVKLGEKQGRQDKAVNNLFTMYFEVNNWNNLEVMVDSWKNNPLLKKRYKILSDCVAIIKLGSKKKINVSNIVLPTLITQIDGALSDYMESKNVSWNGYRDRNTKIRINKPKVFTNKLDNQATDIFLNILFQGSQRGRSLETPFNFNRHKIIHGEIVKYGRKDYMIRAFMVLDLLTYFK